MLHTKNHGEWGAKKIKCINLEERFFGGEGGMWGCGSHDWVLRNFLGGINIGKLL